MSLDQAIALALNNPVKGLSKHAAVLTWKGYVAGTGINQRRTHPLMARFNKHDQAIELHAEIDAIRDALRTYKLEQLKDMTMYVARVLRNGEIANSKPCVGCQRAIVHFGIKDVIFTG